MADGGKGRGGHGDVLLDESEDAKRRCCTRVLVSGAQQPERRPDPNAEPPSPCDFDNT